MLSNPKRITSSTKRKCLTITSSENFIPQSKPSLRALHINLLSPPIINTNNKGERGQPCLSPLELLKKEVGEP